MEDKTPKAIMESVFEEMNPLGLEFDMPIEIEDEEYELETVCRHIR